MLQPGDEIDIWVVESQLGSGGMGSVYRCHNRNAHRIMAAVKVLDDTVAKHPEAEARFIREAEILFQLDHPNIVKVRNIRTDSSPPYLEMEFVSGRSLDSLLHDGPVKLSDALPWMVQIASAVEYLHGKAVRHRDIKPANLLANKEGTIKLVDFGLAVETDHTRITQQGMAFGTVSYAPPEWIKPDTLDPESWDIYAAGVVFYEMLTGEVAFPISGKGSARQQAMQVILAKQDHPALDPGERFRDDIRALIRHMTEPKHEDRAASMAEVRKRCEKLVKLGSSSTSQTLAPDPFLDDEGPSVVIGNDPSKWMSDVGAPTRDEVPPTEDMKPEKRSSFTLMGAIAGILSLGLAFVAAFVVVGLGYFLLSGGSSRPVTVVVAGVDASSKLDLLVAGRASESSDNITYHVESVPIGEALVQWTLGEECTVNACFAGDCPVWCVVGEERLTVPEGTGETSLPLRVIPPKARDVIVPVGDAALTDVPGSFSLGGAPGRVTAKGIRFEGVTPGLAELSLRLGTCPNKSAGCADAECPEGCWWMVSDVPIPAKGSILAAVEIEVPASGEAPPQPKTEEPTPEPGPKAPAEPKPSGENGAQVTVRQLARWLAKNPEWQPEEGNNTHLPGWVGAKPPPGARGAARNISWQVASSYCGGKLPSTTDKPTEWDPPVAFEWRTENGGIRMIESGVGNIPTNGKPMSLAGFRCAQ